MNGWLTECIHVPYVVNLAVGAVVGVGLFTLGRWCTALIRTLFE